MEALRQHQQPVFAYLAVFDADRCAREVEVAGAHAHDLGDPGSVHEPQEQLVAQGRQMGASAGHEVRACSRDTMQAINVVTGADYSGDRSR